MTLRQYLLLMTAGTALSWFAVALIVSNVDPLNAPAPVFIVFYASLFLSLTGTFSVLGFIMRIGLLKQQLVVSRHVAISFRQALLLSVLVLTALHLSSRGLLTWWSALLAVVALTFLEGVFISAKARHARPPAA